MSSARLSWSCVRRPLFINTLPRRVSRRRLSESAATTFPSRNVTVTGSSLPRSVSTPVLRCRPISWKMSAREKSRSVPSSAIASSDHHAPPVDRKREKEPRHRRENDHQQADEQVRRVGDGSERRRQPSGEYGDRQKQQEQKHPDHARDRAPFEH